MNCNQRLLRISRSMLDARQSKLTVLNAKLGAHNPTLLIKQKRQTTNYLSTRLQQATLNLFARKKSMLANAARTLNTVSPLQTLERGYSITLDNKGTPIVSIDQSRQMIQSKLACTMEASSVMWNPVLKVKLNNLIVLVTIITTLILSLAHNASAADTIKVKTAAYKILQATVTHT